MGKSSAPGTGQRLRGDDPASGTDANDSHHHAGVSTSVASPTARRQSGGPKNFEFVLVTNKESRRQVRRHAMRQYMHQRRLDGIARLESSRVQVSGWSRSQPTTAGEGTTFTGIKESNDGKTSTSNDSQEPNKDPNNDAKSPRTLQDGHHEESASDNSGEIMSEIMKEFGTSDPKLMPGRSNSDPFNSYPLILEQVDHNLIHHFMTTYPMMMYKMGDTHQENPVKEIFHRLALHDPLPFQAMLAIASKHQAGVQGQTESVQSLTHKMRALRIMNERLKDDGGKDDGAIYASATMAVIEKWSKDASTESMHIQGITELVRKRGGMRGMRMTSHFLESVLYWVDFSCAPKAIIGASLPWTGDIPDLLPSSLPFITPEVHVPPASLQSSDMETRDIGEIMRACEDFLAFFRSLVELQRSLVDDSSSCRLSAPEQAEATHVSRVNLFNQSTPLYCILTALPDHDHGIRDIRFIDEYSCMACLFYLNTALYDHYISSRNFDHYLQWVNWELRKFNQYENPSIASLLWIFMDSGGFSLCEPSDNGERSWFVSRLLRIAKKLEWTRGGAIWDALRSTLLENLVVQQECAVGSEGLRGSENVARKKRLSSLGGLPWDEDEMRRHILGPFYAGVPVFKTPDKSEHSQYFYNSPANPGHSDSF